MPQYRIDEAKTQLENLIKMALNGETVLIADRYQQIVQLVPVSSLRKSRKAGSTRGHIHLSDDFEAPLCDFNDYQ